MHVTWDLDVHVSWDLDVRCIYRCACMSVLVQRYTRRGASKRVHLQECAYTLSYTYLLSSLHLCVGWGGG